MLIRRTQRFLKNVRQSYTLKLELIACNFQDADLTVKEVRGQLWSNSLAMADGWATDAAGRHVDQSQKSFV